MKISVLGLGAMGSRVARNLSTAGHTVTVWNRTAAVADQLLTTTPALQVAGTAEEAAGGADVVLAMVTDDDAARSVWLEHGALDTAADADAVAVDASTLTVATAQALADAAAERGVDFLEAPVVGSRPQADAGALLVLVGGDAQVLERARPVLEVNAAGIEHLGPVGTAATMKLAINGWFGIQVAAAAELMGVLERSDVPTDAALDLLQQLPVTSPGLQRILGLIGTRSFDPNFPIALVAKDFRYLDRLAHDVGSPTPIAQATAAVYEAACAEHGDLDISGIAAAYVHPI